MFCNAYGHISKYAANIVGTSTIAMSPCTGNISVCCKMFDQFWILWDLLEIQLANSMFPAEYCSWKIVFWLVNCDDGNQLGVQVMLFLETAVLEMQQS